MSDESDPEIMITMCTDGLAHGFRRGENHPACGAEVERAADPGCSDDSDVCETCYALVMSLARAAERKRRS
jgi:hypothetical protein